MSEPRRDLGAANKRIDELEVLALRWNKAVSKYSPVAGSEYVDDPERSLKAIQDASRFGVCLEREACAKIAEAWAYSYDAPFQIPEQIRARGNKGVLWLFTQELEHAAFRAETLGHAVAGRWLRDYSLVISKQAQTAELAEATNG